MTPPGTGQRQAAYRSLSTASRSGSTLVGAATSVWCATSPQLEGEGGVYCMNADIAEVISDFTPQKLGQQPTGVLPWAIDPDIAERLWHLSEKMTGVKFGG